MKYIVRTLPLILILCTLTFVVNAQESKEREERREKYRSMKIAYFTERLELTPEEAEKFWPLYNEVEKKKHELPNRNIRPRHYTQQLENLTDEEIEKITDDIIDARKKEAQLSAEFHEDLKKFLSPKKIMKLYITEVQFREYILRKIRDERAGSKPVKGKNPPPVSLLP